MGIREADGPRNGRPDRTGGSRRSGRGAALAVAALATTLLLVAVGGYTRGSGSGYGCRDRWPLCHDGALGGLLPRADFHMIVEWSHRWLAAVVGVLVVATAVTAWRRYRGVAWVVGPAVTATVLVFVQAWLGALVVKNDLHADLVSLHLANAMIVTALLAVTAVRMLAADGRLPVAAADRGWTVALASAAVLTFAVLILGSVVHNEYVGGWPLVDGRLIPDLDGKVVAVHFVHRLAAGVGLIAVGWLAYDVVRRRRPRAEAAMVHLALACYVANVVFGALHVVTEVRSSAIVVAHLGIASTAWTALVAAALLSLNERSTAAEGAGPPGEAEGRPRVPLPT